MDNLILEVFQLERDQTERLLEVAMETQALVCAGTYPALGICAGGDTQLHGKIKELRRRIEWFDAKVARETMSMEWKSMTAHEQESSFLPDEMQTLDEIADELAEGD